MFDNANFDVFVVVSQDEMLKNQSVCRWFEIPWRWFDVSVNGCRQPYPQCNMELNLSFDEAAIAVIFALERYAMRPWTTEVNGRALERFRNYDLCSSSASIMKIHKSIIRIVFELLWSNNLMTTLSNLLAWWRYKYLFIVFMWIIDEFDVSFILQYNFIDAGALCAIAATLRGMGIFIIRFNWLWIQWHFLFLS